MTTHLSYLNQINQVLANGPFAAAWQSLAGYRVPQWYEDAKFGIFIHWGVYSVPAYKNEWYPRQMYIEGSEVFKHHVETYGAHTQFGYKDFIPMLTAQKFDAAHWADLFRRAGAKFVVPVAEHHDGFAMYDCSFSDWTAVKMGPKRDVVGELAAAVRKEGMVFGVSSHRIEHWWFFNGGMKFPSDVQDARYAGLYGPANASSENHHDLDAKPRPDASFMDDWLARTCELVDKYKPQLLWFDWWIEQVVMQPYLQKFATYYYNRAAEWQRGVAINYKYHAYPEGTAVLDIERGQLQDIRPMFWQTDTSVSKNSWGYIQNHDYKAASAILHDLIDIVSKNGALLLNIGPRPDGTIPETEEGMLLEIGKWLEVNGEAIYGTRPWKTYGEGPTQVAEGAFTDTKRQVFTAQDIRFTTRGDTLYAIVLALPEDGKVCVRSLSKANPFYPGEIKHVQLLGNHTSLLWQQTAEGLNVVLPDILPCNHALVLKVVG